MTESVVQKLGNGLRSLAPTAASFLFVLFGVLPWSSAYSFAPAFALIVVFYWALHRPELLPPAVVFGLGLIHDALSGEPLGLTALALLIAYGTVRSQRRHLIDKPLVVSWFAFATVAIAYAGLLWIVAALRAGIVIDAAPAFMQAFVSVVLYPIFAWLLSLIRRGLPE